MSLRYCQLVAMAVIAAGSMLSSARAQSSQPAAAIPDSFQDPVSGLRVLHLARFPHERSGVVYFHQNSFTADGRYALFDEQFEDKWRHLYAFDFKEEKVIPLVTHTLTHFEVVAPKSGLVYYYADEAAWSVNIMTRETRKIAPLPKAWGNGTGFAVNADETLLVGATGLQSVAGSGASDFERQTNAKRTDILYSINIQTGDVKEILRENAWLGHVQFSPTDPKLLMFCHEGNWEKVDRIWNLRIGESTPTLVYKRTAPRVIAGHEFWSPDGKRVWFQQTDRAVKGIGYVMGVELATGQQKHYRTGPNWGGIHETWSHDGSFMIGDGDSVHKGIYLLEPAGDQLNATQLVDTSANNYKLAEPNPHISPDNRWVIFTATLTSGPPQAFAVELPERLWKK